MTEEEKIFKKLFKKVGKKDKLMKARNFILEIPIYKKQSIIDKCKEAE